MAMLNNQICCKLISRSISLKETDWDFQELKLKTILSLAASVCHVLNVALSTCINGIWQTTTLDPVPVEQCILRFGQFGPLDDQQKGGINTTRDMSWHNNNHGDYWRLNMSQTTKLLIASLYRSNWRFRQKRCGISGHTTCGRTTVMENTEVIV